MKNTYPKYKKGELQEIEKKLSKKDKELIEEFLTKCGITVKTKPKLEKIRRILFQFYDITEKHLDEQDKRSVNTFMALLNSSDRSVWTKNEIKVYIKQFLKRVYKDLEMIEDIKTDNKRELNPQKITENSLINDKDIEKMLRFATSFKEKAYLLLSYTTGARPVELINLKFKDLNFEKDYCDICLFSPKTQRTRTFPVVGETMKALWEWKQHYPFPDVKSQDYVFPSRWRERPLSSNGINKMLRRLASKANVDKDIWGYLLRHSRATRLYEELPTPIVEQLMGHQDQYKTYAHISSKKAREELLKKIYNVEELTSSEKEEFEKMKEEVKELSKHLEIQFAYNLLFSKFYTGKISKEKFRIALKELQKLAKTKGVTNFKY